MQGIFQVGQDIEIRPGYEIEEQNKKVWKPIITKINGLMTGNKHVDKVAPGGSIGVMTLLDPFMVKSDSLTGSVVGLPDRLYPVWQEFSLDVHLLERVIGSKDELEVTPIRMGEILMLNANSAATVGSVFSVRKDIVQCKLQLPVCAEKGSRVTIS